MGAEFDVCYKTLLQFSKPSTKRGQYAKIWWNRFLKCSTDNWCGLGRYSCGL